MDQSSSREENSHKEAMAYTCSDIQLEQVSKKITRQEFHSLARCLGVDRLKVEDIEHKCMLYKYADSEIPYEILKLWQQQCGSEATEISLVEMLINMGREDIVCQVFPDSLYSQIGIHERNLRSTSSLKLTNCEQKIKIIQKNHFKHLHLPRSLWLEKKKLGLEEFFVELVMTKIKTGQEVSEEIKMSKIFSKENPDIYPRILVLGHPGYGKTTLLLKLLSDWGAGVNYISDVFNLVFVVPLRNFKGLQSHLLQQCQGVCTTEKEVVKLIEATEEHVLLLLDGWDEATEETKISLLPLLKGKQHPHMTVILTCRTGLYSLPKEDDENFLSAMEGEGFSEYKIWEKRIQIRGISYEKRKEFLKRYLDIEMEALEEQLSASSVNLTDFYECPLFLLLLAVLLQEKRFKVTENKTELYKTIFNFVLKRSLVRESLFEKENELDIFDLENQNSLHYRKMMILFGKLCLNKVTRHAITFDETEISSHSSGEGITIVQLGFLSKDISFLNYEEKESYQPIHRSFLEFLAAFFLSCLEEKALKTEIEYMFKKGLGPNTDELVFSFLGGLLQSEYHKLLTVFCPIQGIFDLFDIGQFECIYHLSHILFEVSPNEDNLLALKPFIPEYVVYYDGLGLPPEFLYTWINLLAKSYKEIIFSQEIKLGIDILEIEEFTKWIPENFAINKLVLEVQGLHKMTAISTEKLVHCHQLFMVDVEGHFLNYPKILKELMSKFRFEEISLKVKCSFKQESKTFFSKIFRRKETQFNFYKELISGDLKGIKFNCLSLTEIYPHDFHKHSKSIEILIQSKIIEFGLEISFEECETIHFIEKELNELCTAVSNSNLKSFSLDVNNVEEAVSFPSTILNNNKEWKYLELRGKFIATNLHNLETNSVEELSCLHFGSRDINFLSTLFKKCNNLKKLSCDGYKDFPMPVSHDLSCIWEGFETIKQLRLFNIELDEHFLSTVSSFSNLIEIELHKFNGDINGGNILFEMVSCLIYLKKLTLEPFKATVSPVMEQFIKRLSDGSKKINFEELVIYRYDLNLMSSKDFIENLEKCFITCIFRKLTFTVGIRANSILRTLFCHYFFFKENFLFLTNSSVERREDDYFWNRFPSVEKYFTLMYNSPVC